jgi:hypothetical protein
MLSNHEVLRNCSLEAGLTTGPSESAKRFQRMHKDALASTALLRFRSGMRKFCVGHCRGSRRRRMIGMRIHWDSHEEREMSGAVNIRYSIFYVRPQMMTFEGEECSALDAAMGESSLCSGSLSLSFGDGGSGSFFVISSSAFNFLSIFIHFFSRFLCFFISFSALNLNLLSSTVRSFLSVCSLLNCFPVSSC